MSEDIKWRYNDFHVVHDEHDILVVNKLPGMHMHGCHRDLQEEIAAVTIEEKRDRDAIEVAEQNRSIRLGEGDTIMTRIRHYLETHNRTVSFLGHCHQLDTPTSGILAFALSRPVVVQMHELFHQGQVNKFYVAIVADHRELHSILSTSNFMTIDDSIGHNKQDNIDRKECISNANIRGRSCVTRVLLLDTGRLQWQDTNGVHQQVSVSRLLISPHTGRRHQIRLHLQHVGIPIIGDCLYNLSTDFTPPRMFLHAWKLRISLAKDKLIDVASPTPFEDMYTPEVTLASIPKHHLSFTDHRAMSYTHAQILPYRVDTDGNVSFLFVSKSPSVGKRRLRGLQYRLFSQQRLPEHVDAAHTAAIAFCRRTFYISQFPYGTQPLFFTSRRCKQDKTPSCEQIHAVNEFARQLRRGGSMHACILNQNIDQLPLNVVTFLAPVGDLDINSLDETYFFNAQLGKHDRNYVHNDEPGLFFKWFSQQELRQFADPKCVSRPTNKFDRDFMHWMQFASFDTLLERTTKEALQFNGALTLSSLFDENEAYHQRTFIAPLNERIEDTVELVNSSIDVDEDCNVSQVSRSKSSLLQKFKNLMKLN